MAETQLNTGATSFAAANWADATGFANSAQLAIVDGSQTINAGLDQSALGTGINYLEVRSGFSGIIGGNSGPLIVDADAGSSPHITYAAGGGAFYLRAGGGSSLISRFDQKSNGRAYLTNGTFTEVNLTTGTLVLADAATATTVVLSGGTATLDGGGAGTSATIIVLGGTHRIRRPAGTLLVVVGGTVHYEAPSGSSSVLSQYGGTVYHYSGDLDPTYYSGSYDPTALYLNSTLTSPVKYPNAKVKTSTDGATLTLSASMVNVGIPAEGLPI